MRFVSKLSLGVVLAGLALGLTAAPSLAQTASIAVDASTKSTPTAPSDPVAALLQARGETYSRAPDAEQIPEELRQTRSLNAEIAARNDMASSQERADQAAYDAAQAEYRERSAAAETDRVQYEANVRASADAQARYEHAVADWQATVRACQAGDHARCTAGSQPPAY